MKRVVVLMLLAMIAIAIPASAKKKPGIILDPLYVDFLPDEGRIVRIDVPEGYQFAEGLAAPRGDDVFLQWMFTRQKPETGRIIAGGLRSLWAGGTPISVREVPKVCFFEKGAAEPQCILVNGRRQKRRK